VITLTEKQLNGEKVCFEIQKFLLNKSATFVQIVESCNAAKATVGKYLDELVDEGKIIWKPKRNRGKNKYALSNDAKDEIMLLLEKQKIKTQIDQMTPKNFNEFKKFLDFLAKSKDQEEFLLQFPNADHPEKIKIIKNMGTQSFVQD
jgi:predicted transcriptional regulator